MGNKRFALARVAITCCVAIAAYDAEAATGETGLHLGKPLTTGELFHLYQGRSWLWKDGAGYFSSKQRRFTAWTSAGEKASVGDGRWFLTDPGKLCFKADWRAGSGSASALTCFSHRWKGSDVYQRREPDGEWYLFKHSSLKSADEYAKLVRGDYVSNRFRAYSARSGATD